LRIVCAVDYNSEYFAWDVEDMDALSEVQEDLVVVKDEKDRRTQKTRKTQINHLVPGSANRDNCNRVTTMARWQGIHVCILKKTFS
jgi:hypothetical protein